MSATNRKQGVKSPNEFYRTPEYATASLLRALPELAEYQSGAWLEHSAGDGAIIKAVENFGYHPRWHAIELRDEMNAVLNALPVGQSIRVGTGLTYQWASSIIPGKYDVSIGNPPFTQACEFTELSWQQAKITIMLQRLGWMGPKERVSFFREKPPAIKIISPRPFPDATEYAWFCWGVGTPGTWEIIT